MTAPALTPQVSARIGALILRAAAAKGVEAHGLMQAAGFEQAWLADPDARMPLSVEERLWAMAAQRTADPLFGLHAAAVLRPGTFDVLDYAARTAPDLQGALERLARYNRLVHDLASFVLVPLADTVRIEHRFDAVGVQPCRHASEFTLASLVVVASQLVGEPVKARAVEFAHPTPVDVAAFASVFGVTPRFGAPVSCLVLDTALLRRAVPAADPGLSRIVTAHAEQLLAARGPEQDSVVRRVQLEVARQLSDGAPSLTRVARELNMGERSLQRRLQEEGTSFAAVVDEVRRELAMRYIADGRLALGEVAYLLGFAEPSPFHRAFKRWTGRTPAAARRELGRQATGSLTHPPGRPRNG